MSLSCGGCGARVFEGADWCTQCFTPASEAVATPASVPTAFPAPAAEPPRAAAPAPVRQAPVMVPAAPAPVAPAPAAPAPAPSPAGYGPGANGADTADGRPARTNWWEEPTGYQEPVASWTPGSSRAGWDPGAAGLPGLAPPRRVDGSVVRLGVLMVGLGLVTTIVVGLWASGSGLQPVDALKYGMYSVVGLYAVVMAAVVVKGRTVEFQPMWTRGDGVESLLVGLLVGGGLATGLLLLSRLLTGQVQVDQGISVIVSEGTPIRYFMAFLIACVAAPWVEELLFRGLLAESMAPWGEQKAALVSAVLFAAWHPQALFPLLQGRTGPLQYYIVAGLVLATVYHRRGLKASIAAHTAFNGLLVVMAIVVAVGPSHVIEANGVSLTAPGSWRAVSPEEAEGELAEAGEAAELFDMIVQGPSGAGLLVLHVPVPDGTTADAGVVAQSIADEYGGAGTIEPVEYPMGPGMRIEAKVEGLDTIAVAVPGEGVVWVVMLVSGGSERAVSDFDKILETVQLPAAA